MSLSIKPFFRLSGRVDFFTFSGEVVGSSKHAETHISSSGGGGYISRHGGIISAPKIHQRIETIHEFWVKSEREERLLLSDGRPELSVRPGQQVTVLYAGSQATPNSFHPLVLINHSTGVTGDFDSVRAIGDATNTTYTPGAFTQLFASILLSVLGATAGLFVGRALGMGGGSVAPLLILGGLGWVWPQSRIEKSLAELKDALSAHVSPFASELLKSGPRHQVSS